MVNFGRIIIAAVAAFGAMYALIALLDIYRAIKQSRLPTDEKLLRPPGESLSRKIAKLDDKLMFTILLLIAAPVWFAVQSQSLPFVVFFVLLILLTILFSIPLWLVHKQRRNYALGLLGERAVGEELNQLLRDGCHVFHDYPGGPNWNIDHIVVAPSGVYAIETKTRRKRRAPMGRRAHEVIFDGKLIHFPHCSDAYGLEQARRNAVDLSFQLTRATGETVKAKPILTFPGWLVTLKGKSDVSVLNPKQIRSVILGNGSPALTPAQMQRIIHQLDQKCRDVEL
jgi:hypothetical protein